MKRLGIVLLCAVGGYLCSAVLGYFLIGLFSSNTHDRSVEAAMTGAFVFGPLGALVGIVSGVICSKRKTAVRGASGEGTS